MNNINFQFKTLSYSKTDFLGFQLKIEKRNSQHTYTIYHFYFIVLFSVLFSISLFYFICNLPYSVVTLINNLSALPIVGSFSFDIVLFISAIYPSYDFFIYFASSSEFRKHFFAVLRCVKENKSIITQTNELF
jgi:hypothetical protein